jgi:DNA-binding response OmpR family regulator
VTVRLGRDERRAIRATDTKLSRRPFGLTGPGRTVDRVTPPIDVRVGTAPTVLVVDDEPMVREVVSTYLQRDGLVVHEAADGAAALEWLADHRPDLVVLDIMLPGTDGLTILRRLRAEGQVPVILLTARADEVDRVVGLELGADDYVVKPFSPRELAARVRNVLRRSAAAAPPPTGEDVIEHGALRIDPVAREVHVDGRPVTLTPKEFDLLVVLARSPRRVFSRRQLLADVWDSAPEYQDPATVTVHVGRLRQKLEADPDEPRWITTARGVGYRFEP